MTAKSSKDSLVKEYDAGKATPEVVRYPKALEEWAASAKRHALDPYLEDVNALIEQGVDAEGDRSVRVVSRPPNEQSNGKPRIVVIGTVPEAVEGVMRDLQSPFHLEGVQINRPSKEMMAQLAQRMNGLTAAALPTSAEAPARALPPKSAASEPVRPMIGGAKKEAPPRRPYRVEVYDVEASAPPGAHATVIAESKWFRLVSEAYDWLAEWNDRAKNQGFPAHARIFNGTVIERVYDRPRSRLQRVS